MNLEFDKGFQSIIEIPQQEDLVEDLGMHWTEPEYSGKAVGKAGEILINPSSEGDYVKALIIANNWRSSHAFPLNSIQTLLRRKALQVDKDVIVTQRLKRVPSIEKKLKRFSNMKLQRMQDIGGCRAVVQDVDRIYRLKELMLNSSTKNLLVGEDDYIRNPKESGYRGIHLIYKYGGAKDDIYNRHKVEIQIRSQIQHAWATTVEIAGAFLGEGLKSGEGSNEWLYFFRLVSILFSSLEGCTLNSLSKQDIGAIKCEVRELSRILSVSEKLQAFSVSVNFLEHHIKKSGYFLLILDIQKQSMSINYYETKDLEIATRTYIFTEQQYKNRKNIDVVLVAASSIKNLKKGYPNYFADSRFFIENLQMVTE